MVAVVSGPGVLLTLDRRLPESRLQVMLDQTRARFLVVVDEPGAELPPIPLERLRVLHVDPTNATTAVAGARQAMGTHAPTTTGRMSSSRRGRAASPRAWSDATTRSVTSWPGSGTRSP